MTPVKTKDIEIINLNGQLTESREKVTKLQAEIKLKTQPLKIDEKTTDVIEQHQAKIKESITGRLETIEHQLKKQSEKTNKTYREMAANTDKLEQQQPIPLSDEHFVQRETVTSQNDVGNEKNNSEAFDKYDEPNRSNVD